MNPIERAAKVVQTDFNLEAYAKDHPNSRNREGQTAYEEFVAQSKKKHQGLTRVEGDKRKPNQSYNDLQFDA